ncbi:MAG: hypothetical protein KC589_08120, partial [Nanoarchaeota archaeon]|nr:hypothetical protein [Nanoarchaeota archaeon]
LLGVLGYWLYTENQKKSKKSKSKNSSSSKRSKRKKSRKSKKSSDSKPETPINLTVNVNDYETQSPNGKTLVKEVVQSGN